MGGRGPERPCPVWRSLSDEEEKQPIWHQSSGRARRHRLCSRTEGQGHRRWLSVRTLEGVVRTQSSRSRTGGQGAERAATRLLIAFSQYLSLIKGKRWSLDFFFFFFFL